MNTDFDFTEYVKDLYPNIKTAIVGLVTYDYDRKCYVRCGGNYIIKEEEIEKYLCDTIERMKQELIKDFSLSLNTETVVLEFDNGRNLVFNASECGFIYF